MGTKRASSVNIENLICTPIQIDGIFYDKNWQVYIYFTFLFSFSGLVMNSRVCEM